MQAEEKFIRIATVVSMVGLPKTSIYDAVREGSFPKPVKLGVRSSAWRLSEVQKWMQDRILERDAA